jgi:hypothetical protein
MLKLMQKRDFPPLPPPLYCLFARLHEHCLISTNKKYIAPYFSFQIGARGNQRNEKKYVRHRNFHKFKEHFCSVKNFPRKYIEGKVYVGGGEKKT